MANPTPLHKEELSQKLVDILKELQIDTMAVESVDKGDYDSDVEYLTAKLHWAEVQIERMFESHYHSRIDSIDKLVESKRRKLYEPVTNRVVTIGEKVQIDLEADPRASLKFVQANGHNQAIDTVRTILEEERKQHG